MKSHIMQLSIESYYFLPLRSKCSPQEPYLHTLNLLSSVKWLNLRFRVVIGITGVMKLVTSNYSAIAISHSVQFTMARTKSSQSVFIIRCFFLHFLTGRWPSHSSNSGDFPPVRCVFTFSVHSKVDRLVKLLWILASTVVLGFRSRRGFW
jgi:hypothetical protein